MLQEKLIKELILQLFQIDKPKQESNSFYQVGEDYVVRSVTMIYLGKLKQETQDALILEDCAWIPETSRWSDFLTGTKPKEMEPYPDDVIIYKGALLDVVKMKNKIEREVI